MYHVMGRKEDEKRGQPGLRPPLTMLHRHDLQHSHSGLRGYSAD